MQEDQILLFIFIMLDIRVNFDLILRKGDCQIVTNGMKLESAVDDSPWNALVYDWENYSIVIGWEQAHLIYF